MRDPGLPGRGSQPRARGERQSPNSLPAGFGLVDQNLGLRGPQCCHHPPPPCDRRAGPPRPGLLVGRQRGTAGVTGEPVDQSALMGAYAYPAAICEVTDDDVEPIGPWRATSPSRGGEAGRKIRDTSGTSSFSMVGVGLACCVLVRAPACMGTFRSTGRRRHALVVRTPEVGVRPW